MFAATLSTTSSKKQNALQSSPNYGARFTPSSILFENAYEGKKFTKIVEVQNCSTDPILVRVGTATSSCLRIISAKKEYILCSGFKCRYKIYYTYRTQTAIPIVYFPIFINGNSIDYEVKVTSNFSQIVCKPQELNFGSVNVKETNYFNFALENIGSRNSSFALDLGLNQAGLVVLPMKGIIPAKSKVNIQIIILGEEEAEYDTEIWIKCNIPKKIRIFGKVVIPRLVTTNELTCNYFTLLQFPTLYYGEEISRVLIVENSGSTICMYCSDVLIDGKMEYFTKCRNRHRYLKWININPSESRLEPHQKITVQFRLKPIKEHIHKDMEKVVEFVRLRRINCKDLEYEFADEDTFSSYISTISTRKMSKTTVASAMPSIKPVSPDVNVADDIDYSETTIDNHLNVCIYSEVIVAEISAIPLEDYSEKKYIVNTVNEFELSIKNESSILPIHVTFKKVCYVNMEPPKLQLNPDEYATIKILITPMISGRVKQEISLDLHNRGFHVGTTSFTIQFEAVFSSQKKELVPKFNMGITPRFRNEVGTNVENVRFTTNVQMPRNAVACLSKKKLKSVGDYLVAFPNDRPNTLLPIDLPAQSLTIFANLPRIKTVKNESKSSYFNNYIKKKASRTDKYMLPKIKHKFGKNATMVCKRRPASFRLKKNVLPEYKEQFLILTPLELANVEISPHRVVLRKVAPNTDVISVITVQNKNDFNIYVRLQSSKSEISFATLNNITIEQNSTKSLKIWYNSYVIGKNIAPLQAVINNAHVFELNVIAMVIPKEVNVNREFIDIDPNDRSSEFFELKNPLNSPVLFNWEINSCCFNIFPINGIIPPERNILCHIQFTQLPKTSDSTVIILKTEDGNEKHIKLTYLSKNIHVSTDVKGIEFVDLPINILRYKTFIIKNDSQVPASFYLNNPNLIYGLSITPTQGIIPRKGIQNFVVRAVMTVPISFSRIISIHVERCRDIDIEVKCSVVFPKIDVIPNFLKIKNIVPDSIIRSKFQLKNLNDFDTKITFDFTQYPEFTVSVTRINNPIEVYLLKSNETKTFYLHCSPKEATAFGLYLPFSINDLIGPIILNNPRTRYVEYFLDNFKKYNHISSVTKLPYPKMLHYCKITTVVSASDIKFSNFTIKLNYHHLPEYQSQNIEIFEARNITNDKTVEYCIRTDNLSPPFEFEYSEGKIVEKNVNSLFCSLDPGEYTIFSIRFQPELMKFGYYQRELPLYVKNLFECTPFNTITLQGIYNKPTIKTKDDNERIIYFQPSCTMFNHEHPLYLEVNYHSNKCTFYSFCARPELQVIFKDGRRIYSGCYTVKIVLVVAARRPMKIDDKVTFGCSCGRSKLDVYVKGFWDNCIPTAYSTYFSKKMTTLIVEDDFDSVRTHSSGSIKLTSDSTTSTITIQKSISLLENQKDFPLFPDDSDNSDYAIFMREVLNVVESWLNCQGLYNATYCILPDTLNIICNDTLPLVKLLINFGGNEIKKYLDANIKPNIISNTDNNVITYQLCINLLKSYNAPLAHVEPEYLLDYDSYENFIKNYSNEPPLEVDIFTRKSKQCWIDIILQVYKIFVLSRIENPSSEAKNSAIVTNKLYLTNSKALQKFITSKIPDIMTDYYSLGECILLKWAEMHFDMQQKKLWGGPLIKKYKYRRFENFDEDFIDSLCFGAILYSFFPFLDSIKDMFFNPDDNEELLYHNANIFCNVWYKLKLSFEIKPQQIIKPNVIQILMLLNYMYEILPNFYPSETVTLKASLSQTIEHKILIENNDNRRVMYYLMFFGVHSEYFKSANQFLCIGPRNKSILPIKFYAKKLETCSATLILCGEVPGAKYSTSMAMNLISTVTATEVKEENLISKRIYETYTERVKFHKIPPGVYDLYYGTEDGLCAFTEPDKSKLPQIANLDKQITIDENGEGIQRIDGLMISVNRTTMFIFGRNKEVGDFVQKLTFCGTYDNKVIEKLYEILPQNFKSIKCTCKSTETPSNYCNRTRNIKIPLRNNLLWQSLVDFMVENTKDETAEVLKNILSSPSGSNILKRYCDFKENKQLKDVMFLENIEYNINFPQECGKAPDTVFFQNVYDNGYIEIPVHINTSYDIQKPIRFRMDSKGNNNYDTRFYNLTFATQ